MNIQINPIHVLRITLAGMMTLLSASVVPQTIKFRDATQTYKVPGHMLNGARCYGHGSIMADITGDNRPDIYISNAVRDAYKLAETLYISVPGGYQENDKARRVEDSYGWTGSHGIVFFDYDNDGDYDIYNATTDDRNRLYRNDGSGYFDDVTAAAGLPKIHIFMPDFDSTQTYGYGTRGVVAFDANNDGWMDLYGVNWGPAEKRYGDSTGYHPPIKTPPQPNEFYLNQGNGTFIRVENSGATPINPANVGSQGVTVFDADEDGDMDIFVCHRNYVAIAPNGEYIGDADYTVPVYNQLFLNDGSGHFSEHAADAGLTNDPYNNCNGATFADYDNDGDYDAFVLHKKYTFMHVYRNDGNGRFTDVTEQLRLSAFGFSCFLFDADNDGDLDLLNPRTREYTYFYRNDGGVYRRDDDTGLWKKSFDPRGGSIGDVDNDGDLDVYYVDANKELIITLSNPSYPDTVGNHLFLNDTETGNGWLKVSGRGPRGDAGGFGSKIWVYDRGHMDELSHLVGYRQVINAYGYLCQDDPVQHFGLGPRDTVDVKIRLMDNTTLKLYQVTKNQRLYFSKPAQISKVSGDLQNGTAGVALPQPLRVRVRDAYDKILYGTAVTFTPLTAGGQISTPQPIYCDAEGIAKVTYIPVAGITQQKIRASLVDAPAVHYDFTCTVSSLVSYHLSPVSGDGQSGPVNETLPAAIVVELRDDFNHPAPAIPVVFKIMAGGGKINAADSITIQTDTFGRAAATWRLGSIYHSEQKLRVCVQSDRGEYVDFSAHTWGGPAELKWLSAFTHSAQVARALPDSLTAQIVDAEGHAVKNEFVKFSVDAGGGTVNGAASVHRLTNHDGLASVQWILGTAAGTLNNRLRVEATTPQGSPKIIQATALPGPAAVMQKISGDEQTAFVNQALDSAAVVAVVDSFANPVSGLVLTAEVKSPDGRVNTIESAVTDSQGRASFHWSVANDTGLYEFTVRHGALAPVVFTAHAVRNIIYSMQKSAGDQQTGRAGHQLEHPLKVIIRDELNQLGIGLTVQFIVQAGGGSVTPSTSTTNDSGWAAVYWTLGPSGDQAVKAQLSEQPDKSALFTAALRPNQAPTVSCVSDTLIYESQVLYLKLRVADADGDSVTVRAGDLPAGAAFDASEFNFSWQPMAQQAGSYRITFIADDGQPENSTDSAMVRIEVVHVNHAPQLIQAVPADTVVQLVYYRPRTFAVAAQDPDGDSLRYVWSINGAYITSDSTVSLMPTPALSLPAQLKVRIFDAEITIEHVWHLDVQTEVSDAGSERLSYSLNQNYPNPFNAVTHIAFMIPQTDRVSVRVYNAAGQLIRTLAEQPFAAGLHRLCWDGTDEGGHAAPSGIYYYIMECGSFKQLKKMVLLK